MPEQIAAQAVLRVLDDAYSWEEVPVPGKPGVTEWRNVRVIKSVELLGIRLVPGADPLGPLPPIIEG